MLKYTRLTRLISQKTCGIKKYVSKRSIFPSPCRHLVDVDLFLDFDFDGRVSVCLVSP